MKKTLLGLALLLSMTGMVYAANYDNPIEGRLKALYSDFITLSIPSTVSRSSDVNALPYGDMDINLIPGTAYVNFHRLTDLKQGDTVSVLYFENNRGNKNVASRITKIRSASDPVVDSVTTTNTTVTTSTVTHKEVNP